MYCFSASANSHQASAIGPFPDSLFLGAGAVEADIPLTTLDSGHRNDSENLPISVWPVLRSLMCKAAVLRTSNRSLTTDSARVPIASEQRVIFLALCVGDIEGPFDDDGTSLSQDRSS